MVINWEDLHARVAQTLCELIRINTTNPPGNETPCAEYIRRRLAAEGIEATVLEAAPGRGSVVGRLRGNGSAAPLLLMSHIDVVAVEPQNWSCDPFAGEIRDNCIWGRGSLDTKDLTAIGLELLLLLKRSGVTLNRDVILAGTADEEAGGSQGMSWLVDNHWDLIQAEYAINEGGGLGEQVGGRWVFPIQTAEKGVCWTRAWATGAPGHGSTPITMTSVAKLVAALERLTSVRLSYHLVPAVETYIRQISKLMSAETGKIMLGLLDPATESASLAALPELQGATMRASLHNTATPTMLRAGEKINVIPSIAEAQIDCRMLPGQSPESVLEEVRALLGPDIQTEILWVSRGAEFSSDTPLMAVIKEVMSEKESGSVVMPSMVTAMTDARFFASKGTTVYGFVPWKHFPGDPHPMHMAHGNDERIALDKLAYATTALWEIIRRFCAA